MNLCVYEGLLVFHHFGWDIGFQSDFELAALAEGPLNLSFLSCCRQSYFETDEDIWVGFLLEQIANQYV